MTKIFILIFISFQISITFASVEVGQVLSQFLNIHGADWSSLAKSQEDWNDIRYWHEKIIENPETISEVYPQPGMIEYLLPNAIHSYGKLIGENHIDLDERSKQILEKLAIDISEGKNTNPLSNLEAIGLTNSPWGVSTLRNLLTESDSNLNQKVFSSISDVLNRFDKQESTLDLDTEYQNSQIDFSKNPEQWKKEIYEIRKTITKLAKTNPELKANKVFSEISKSSNLAAKVIQANPKAIKKTTYNESSTKQEHIPTSTDKTQTNIPLNKESKDVARSIASEENNQNRNFYILLALGIIFFIVCILVFKMIRKR